MSYEHTKRDDSLFKKIDNMYMRKDRGTEPTPRILFMPNCNPLSQPRYTQWRLSAYHFSQHYSFKTIPYA